MHQIPQYRNPESNLSGSKYEEYTSGMKCTCLVLSQMTSDHNRSELGIQDHSNEPSSSKLVPKVVPLAVKTATSRQELELLFHHHIAMPRTTEMQNAQPSRAFGFSQQKLVSFVTEIHMLSIDISFRIVDMNRWQTAPASEYKNQNALIESRAKRSINKSSIRHIPYQTLLNIKSSSQAVIKVPTRYHCEICQNIQSDTL
ncbi:hypothetical protein Tco_0992072 [Tanacetum coccineum]|uniref:Uncharacterized protein n=1 Tax=Tanacetum coccineum TaxID=301880 RepID=A0ABQ5F1V5_9ASTR